MLIRNLFCIRYSIDKWILKKEKKIEICNYQMDILYKIGYSRWGFKFLKTNYNFQNYLFKFWLKKVTNWQSIPESLTARLLNVAVLDVHSNQLKTLPNSIGCLSKLKNLNVSGNLLQSLPRTIENCRYFILWFHLICVTSFMWSEYTCQLENMYSLGYVCLSRTISF